MSKIIDVKRRHKKEVCLSPELDTVAEFYRKKNALEQENNDGFFIGIGLGMIILGVLMLFIEWVTQ
ncbi:MAG: hypothetical protein RL755_29 [Pseudomonadota bacterium]|jgi:hypothetical protein